MTKTTTAGMDAHLLRVTTSLAMATVIERTDGVKLRLTTSSEDITIDIGDGDGEQVYSAQEGVSRTNLESDSELNVDNLDIIGIFDNVLLKETELRRGLFDFADFKIFVFNHQDSSDGIVKIFRGQLGEVIVTKQDYFRVQVRSMVQVFSKQTGELYSKDCRADLGDIRCRVPLYWDSEEPANKTDRTFPMSHVEGSVAYSVGDFIAVPTAPTNTNCSQFVMNFEDVDGSTGLPGMLNIGTEGNPAPVGTAQIDTDQAPAGGDSTSSLLLDGNSDYLFMVDQPEFEFGANQVTIQFHMRLNGLGVVGVPISKYTSLSNQRSWYFEMQTDDTLRFVVYQTGSTVDITLVGTTVLTTGVDYHIAVVRRADGDWMMFIDGVVEVAATTPTSDPFDSTAPLRVGAFFEISTVRHFFNGWLDSLEMLIGFARWESTFTPPTGNLVVGADPVLIWEDYGDRVYEVTTAGVSSPCISTPDTTISNTHNQGTAVLTAHHSWMRFAEVTAVDVTSLRRIFTVAELTPNTGETVGANRLPATLGFPDDWMNGGGCYFETGDNAGRTVEVRDFQADDGITITQDIELISDLPFDIVIGDKLRIFPGCDKTNAICISKFKSGITFVGEPYVPGEDVMGQYPDAR